MLIYQVAFKPIRFWYFVVCLGYTKNLNGLTSAEAWPGYTQQDIRRNIKSPLLVQALDGSLVGYHVRR